MNYLNNIDQLKSKIGVNITLNIHQKYKQINNLRFRDNTKFSLTHIDTNKILQLRLEYAPGNYVIKCAEYVSSLREGDNFYISFKHFEKLYNEGVFIIDHPDFNDNVNKKVTYDIFI